MRIDIPDPCLVVLIGASGSGKTTFCRKHFKSTEVLSSDFFRGLVADDEADQTATGAAFACLHFVAEKRLLGGRLTVIDATSVKRTAREPLLRLARERGVQAVAVVLDMPGALCVERNAARPGRRNVGARVVESHLRELRQSLPGLREEGFREVFVFHSPEDLEGLEISRTPRAEA